MTARKTNIWERLRAIRSHWGITQSEMATRMGVSPRAYQNYETNEREPKAGDVAALALWAVNLNWLLTGDGEMFHTGPGAAGVALSTLVNDLTLPGQPVSAIDEHLLAETLRLVEDWLSANRRTMTAARKAEVAASIYAMAVEDAADGKPAVDQRRVAQILKLVG